jgi:hypothetical protein
VTAPRETHEGAGKSRKAGAGASESGPSGSLPFLAPPAQERKVDYVSALVKNSSRLAILAAAFVLGGASIFLVGNAADLAAAPSPSPGAAQQEQTGEHSDPNDADNVTENEAGSQGQDPAGATEQEDQAGGQGGHEDVPGTPDQTGDHQD